MGSVVRKLTKPFKKVAKKLVPKEAAGIMQMAAPFVSATNPWLGGAMYGLGSLKQRGRINPLMLALSTAPGWKFTDPTSGARTLSTKDYLFGKSGVDLYGKGEGIGRLGSLGEKIEPWLYGTKGGIQEFDVGKPGKGEELTKNRETGQVTGRNIFIYAVTKGGKKVPVAVKTQRSKQGESGKLSTTYQWHKDTQNCFKEKS